MKTRSMRLRKRSRVTVCLVAFMTMFAGSSCNDVLDVNNPNSVLEDQLDNPVTAPSLANGALVTVSYAASEILSIYTTASDEGTWIGSRDGWNQLRQGNIGDPNNEFTDDAWQWITQARWMADKAVELNRQFDNDGSIENRSDLVKSLLYAAVIRIMVADAFDDFVISDRREPAPPIGEDNMFSMYEDAVSLLDETLALAREIGDGELESRAITLRARAKHARAVWDMVNPRGSAPPALPYVDAGREDAEAAMGLLSNDWRWQFTFSAVSAIQGSSEGNDFSWQANGRLELAIFTPLATDPIDGVEDPRIANTTAEFTNTAAFGGSRFAPLTVITAREMYLIIAESDFVRGNLDAAKGQLNALRALDGLTAITTEDVGEMIQHERRANLFLQARRLADMYRFGIKSPEWLATSEAANSPGSFFPIARREIEANPFVSFGDR